MKIALLFSLCLFASNAYAQNSNECLKAFQSKTSLFSGGQVEKILLDLFGAQRMEDINLKDGKAIGVKGQRVCDVAGYSEILPGDGKRGMSFSFFSNRRRDTQMVFGGEILDLENSRRLTVKDLSLDKNGRVNKVSITTHANRYEYRRSLGPNTINITRSRRGRISISIESYDNIMDENEISRCEF